MGTSVRELGQVCIRPPRRKAGCNDTSLARPIVQPATGISRSPMGSRWLDD